MPVAWSDEIDEILTNDVAAGFAYATPAKGVVIAPMTPFGMRDRERGTVTFTTSLGLPRKLIRIRSDPHVAVAYHAREHSESQRPEFVLVQGIASFEPEPDREWLRSITPQWERFLGPRRTGLWGRWLDIYYYERVAITVQIERIVCWPATDCSGAPAVVGTARPGEAPAPQSPPRKGTGARVAVAPLRRHSERLAHTLLGWIGADGFPEVVAARVAAAEDDGAELESAALEMVPPGGRRAGLTSHSFRRHMIGQQQRLHTGWLEREGARIRYFPHTKAGYAMPASKLVFNVGAALATRWGMRTARAAGLAR